MKNLFVKVIVAVSIINFCPIGMGQINESCNVPLVSTAFFNDQDNESQCPLSYDKICIANICFSAEEIDSFKRTRKVRAIFITIFGGSITALSAALVILMHYHIHDEELVENKTIFILWSALVGALVGYKSFRYTEKSHFPDIEYSRSLQ